MAVRSVGAVCMLAMLLSAGRRVVSMPPLHGDPALTARQVRAARVWLGWKQAELATAAGIATRTLAEFELGRRVSRNETNRQLRAAFEKVDVVFEWDERGRGTGLRAPYDGRDPEPPER